MISRDLQNLSQAIDAVAENASSQIAAGRRRRAVRGQVGRAIVFLVVVPIAALLWQLIRWAAGLPVGLGFSWFWCVALSLVLPVLWLAAKALSRRFEVDRLRALGAMDATLGASERVVTADQFLREPSPSGFMCAAVEDAQSWIERGRRATLKSEASTRIRTGVVLLAVPVAVLTLVAAGWLAGMARANAEPAPDSFPAVTARPSDTAEPRDTAQHSPSIEDPVRPKTPREASRQRGDSQASVPSNAAMEGAKESRGLLSDGQTSSSQQSSNPSSAQGAPSSQGQPSLSQPQKPKTSNPPKPPGKDRETPDRQRKGSEEPSGATAGAGSSRGSNNNAAASDWSSRGEEARQDDEPVEDEKDVDDEDEEQKSRGGVQPNLRDRRPPVNRDLQIGFGSGKPSPDSNGRGGPSDQKKSRGVASLVLGVPIPDRVTGQPNRGRIRVTQHSITPQAEQADPVTAEDRGDRQGVVGPVHHPTLSPWLQNLVRRYFLQRRQSNASVPEPSQATGPIESDSIQP